jgi:hypothetical protein
MIKLHMIKEKGFRFYVLGEILCYFMGAMQCVVGRVESIKV